jgi:hypothetical protein
MLRGALEEYTMQGLRKVTLGCATAALLVASVGAPAAAAERERRVAPIVGTWVLDVNVDDTADPPALLTVEPGGTLRLTDCCNGSGAGVWRPARGQGFMATLLTPWYDDDGFVGWNTTRALVTADEDFMRVTYTVDIPARDGTTSGQLGPVHATGVPVAVEGPGETLGSAPVAGPESSPAPSSAPSSPAASPAG